MTGVVTGLRQRSGGGGRLEAVWPAWYSVVRGTGQCGQVSCTMSLGNMDPALVCSGPMSNISYDSHVVTRRRMADELPRIKQNDQPDRLEYS